MICFTDVWSTIWDDNNKPLLGKIEFCEPNTTTLKTIYDGTEVITDNPIYVNGRTTNQVLLGDGDYTVRYYRYIGHGNMEDDDNESSWFNYKTELVKNSITSSGSGSSSNTVDTIAELKAIVPTEGMVVRVNGYNTANDCPARDFIWQPHVTGDDGGYKISSSTTTTGAWVMKVPGTYIDVRWFGDIPDTVANPSTSAQKSNLGQRAAAAECANQLGKDLYFPKGYYIFDGTNTVSVTKDIICDNKVYFVVKTGTVGTKVQCHELFKCDKNLFIASSKTAIIGDYTLIADWIDASWLSNSTASASGARIGYEIDGNDTNRTAALSFKDCRVEVTGSNTYPCSFDNCDITDSPHLLQGTITMTNMTINPQWFVEDYDFENLYVGSNCDVRLIDCNDATQYITLKNMCGKYDYGDCGEQELNNPTIYPTGTLENCYGTVTCDTTLSGTYELHNASLTMNGIKPADSINAVDSWLTVTTNGNVIQSLSMRRGNLTSTDTIQVLTDCYLDNIELSSNLALFGLSTFTIKDCTINSSIGIIGHNDFMITDNKWNDGSACTYQCDSTTMPGTFKNNYLSSGCNGWAYSSTKANTSVTIKWIGNHSEMSTQFTTFDLTNLYVYDSMHNYIYEGNTGKNTLAYKNSYSYIDMTSAYWIDTVAADSTAAEAKGWNFVLCKSSYLLFSSTNDTARQALEGVYMYKANTVVQDKMRTVFSIGQRLVNIRLTFEYSLPSIFWSSSGTAKNTNHDFSYFTSLYTDETTHEIDLSVLNGKILGNVSFAGHNMVDSSLQSGQLETPPRVLIEIG